MRILAIESSTRNAEVAIISCTTSLSVPIEGILSAVYASQADYVCLRCAYSDVNDAAEDTTRKTIKGRSSRTMIPDIQQTLKLAECNPNDVNLVTVSTGPGSFTGLRIGLVTAKTFAFATGSKIIGVNSFETLAIQALGWLSGHFGTNAEMTHGNAPIEAEAPFALSVALNIGRGELLVSEFQLHRTDFTQVSEPVVVTPEDWLGQLPPNSVVTGSGVDFCLQTSESCFERVQQVPRELRTPQVETVARLGLANFRARGGDDFWQLEPVYSRPSYAEEAASQN